LLEVPGSPPAVLGELSAGETASKTIVLYAHYDGQPVDESRWLTPPWQPTLRRGGLESEIIALAPHEESGPDERRLYARSASDDKAPIIAMLAALDALRAAGIAPSVHLKFFFEGEEEAGSPHLAEMLRRYRRDLAADLWIFCDGPVHQSRRQQVVFGVRGVLGAELIVYGATRELHSGHYGNWAPNPAVLLVDLLRSMRDTDGRIAIDGFYDAVRPLTDEDRAAIASVPVIDPELRRELGLASTEADDAPLVERILLPALNVRGIASGNVGEAARNAIPKLAQGSLDFRLVPDQTIENVRELVERHLKRQGYTLLDNDPDSSARLAQARLLRLEWSSGYPATRTALDHPASLALLAAIDRVTTEIQGAAAIRMPILGGSLPLYLFGEILETPLIVLPIVNHDNDQHAANENLRLQNLWDGIVLYAGLIAELGQEWR
jgi:acetylornithine deacetylase/succinyl-diaminopimelate desuccinylase-like protein